MFIDEKDRLTDSLITQKYIASGYNLAALEAANNQLADVFLNILRDEHQIQHDIFNEMKNRGFYQPKAASTSDLGQHLNKWTQEFQRAQNMTLRQSGMQQPGMQQHGMQQSGMQQHGMQQPGMQQSGMQQQQQAGFQGSMPQYGFQTGVGLPQTGADIHQQTMYRPPQNPMI